MQPMLDGWQPSAQEAVLEEPLRFELGSQECNEMSEQIFSFQDLDFIYFQTR